jgi:hypothetical protein
VDRSKYSVSRFEAGNSQRSRTEWLPFFGNSNRMQVGQHLLKLGFSV